MTTWEATPGFPLEDTSHWDRIDTKRTTEMKQHRKHKWIGIAGVISLGCALVGCETVTTGTPASKKKKDSSWSFMKKKEYQVPQSLHVTWAHDTLTLPGKPATRGFGGRFYFYNEKTQAIPVDGDLVVYGFDDTNVQHGKEDLEHADKRFRFTAEQFTTHFSESELGASYSVWIPWDEASGPQRKIMLIPTFVTKDGRLVRGAAAKLNLPGRTTEEQPGLIRQASAVIPTALPGQITNHRQAFQPSSDGRGSPDLSTPTGMLNGTSGLRTTTIQVPANSLMAHSNRPINEDTAAAMNQMNQLQSQLTMQGAAQQSFANFGHLSNGYSPQSAERGQHNHISQPSAVTESLVPPASADYSAANSLSQQPAFSQQPSLSIQPVIGPPTPMPTLQASQANGRGLPEFSQVPYSAPQAHSSPSQRQAQALQGAPQASYLNR
jgi:hypothetical protein